MLFRSTLYVHLVGGNIPYNVGFTIDENGMFGIFEWGQGNPNCVFECGLVITDLTGNLITSQNPLHQSQTVVVWATGVSSLKLNTMNGLVESSAYPSFHLLSFPLVQGNKSVGMTVNWAGESPQFVGLDQITITVDKCTGANATTAITSSVYVQWIDVSGLGTPQALIPFAVSSGEPKCF